MNRHLRFFAAVLALIAIVSLAGAGMHVHADGAEHPNCWLCLSSIGSVAVQPLSLSIFFAWTCLGLSIAFTFVSHTQTILSAPGSRAPPQFASI